MEQQILQEMTKLTKGAKVTFLRAQGEKINLPNSRAVLLISVGQPVHEGSKFAATIDMLNKNFSSCDVAVCDSLQRHTMEMYKTLPKETLYAKANVEGENWIRRNDISLKSIRIPHKIFRWDEYLLASNFEQCRKTIELAYNEDKAFYNAVHATIDEFITRHTRHSAIIDKERASRCCLRYLIEEAAIIMLMWPSREYNYIVYPGAVNKALEAARNKFVAPTTASHLLKWLGVYVRTRACYKEKIFVPKKEFG